MLEGTVGKVDCGVNGHAVEFSEERVIDWWWPLEGEGSCFDRLEYLLPISTGAKMDRWRKMVIRRIERKHRMK